MSKLAERLAGRTGAIDRPAEPAAEGTAPARSMSMPGQLGAFRMEAQAYKKEIEALQEQLAKALSEARLIKVAPTLLDDSPYQTRLQRNPMREDQVGKAMVSAGQKTPITVRQVKPGRYELLKGQNRKYGAIAYGIAELDALVIDVDDRQARLHVRTDNQVEKLSDFELARMCEAEIEDGEFTTQEQLADLFAVSQTQVSLAMGMLKLPAEVLKVLDTHPKLFHGRTAKIVKSLWEEHKAHHDLILEGLDQIIDEKIPQSGLKSWIDERISERVKKAEKEQRQQQPKAPKPQARRETIKSPSGKECYITILRDNGISVQLNDLTIPPEEVRAKIDELLHDLAKKSDTESN